jgi:hypothetical protein
MFARPLDGTENLPKGGRQRAATAHSYWGTRFRLNSKVNRRDAGVRFGTLLNGTGMVRHRSRADPSNRCVIV